MAKVTINKIRSIEEKAKKIIEDAKHKAVIALKNLHKQQEEEIKQTQEKAQKQAQDLIKKAGVEAQKQAEEITKQTQAQIKALQSKTTKKISEAKKACL